MTRTLDMAMVDTPTHRYSRARVVFNEDESQAVIHDYATNDVLATLSGLTVVSIGTSWTDGDKTTITYDPKQCKPCGGKRTTVRAK